MEYIENDFLFVPWRTLIMDCRGDILTAEGGCLYNFFSKGLLQAILLKFKISFSIFNSLLTPGIKM